MPFSTDGTGATGVPDFLGNQGWYDNTIIVSPTNANEVFAAGQVNYNATQLGQYIAIIGSFDGGSTWHDYTIGVGGNGPHTDHHALAFTADGSALLNGNDGGIWRCENPNSLPVNTSSFSTSVQWTDLNTTLNITQFTGIALHPTDATIAYGGSQDNGTEKYTGSLGWTQVDGGDGGFTRVDQTNPNTVYHEFYGISLQRSDNAGATWTDISGTTGINPNDPWLDGSDPAAFYVPFILDPANQSRILYATDHLYESVDKGAHFVAIGSPGVAGFNPSDYSSGSLGAYGNTIYVYAGGVIYVTTNDGASWTASTLPGNASPVGDIYVSPSNTMDVIATVASFGGGHIYHSTNGGVSWVDISGNIPNEPFNAIKVDTASGSLYAGGDDGVYYSANQGASWTKSNLPNVKVVDLAISPGAGLVAAGTHGRGAFESPLSSVATAPPVITSSLTASGTVNHAFSYQITASNTPTIFSATVLPAGLSINRTTGLISGTPTAPGVTSLALAAANSAGVGRATLTLTITGPPVITSALSATGQAGHAFSYQITASNTPTSFAATVLPAGLTINRTTGLISGTPTASGVTSLALAAANSAGIGRATLTLTINPASALPVITSALSASGQAGKAFTYQIVATNSPTIYSAVGLPAGLNINRTTGLISGTPTASGVFSVALAAANSAGIGRATLSLTINPGPPAITSALTASGQAGHAFTYQIIASNAPTSFAATGLPAGLSINRTTGLITGTPAASGAVSVALAAANSAGVGRATLALTINP